jgi:aryl-alcohol dehydrogenase-like predicted oxidoreductase
MPPLGATGIDVFGLCLGGNVFGWTADEATSFAVLDAYVEAGGNFIDTANMYSHWAPGNSGGESEEIIGRWMASRGVRDEVVIATKVGGEIPGLPQDLRPATIRRAIQDSLTRLQTDRIDLYFAHYDDPTTPLEQTWAAFSELVHEGLVLHLGASNYTADRLEASIAVIERDKLEPIRVLQPEYNLVARDFEARLGPLCERNAIATVPYFSLASGFLTGKYRAGETVDSPRAGAASAYLDDRGRRVLATVGEIATAHATSYAAVALAWLRSKPTVVAPIASARTVEQLPELIAGTSLDLESGEIRRLDAAGA